MSASLGWEGNRRSGVALAMRYARDTSGLSTYGLNRETTPADTPGVRQSFTYSYSNRLVILARRTRLLCCATLRSLIGSTPWSAIERRPISLPIAVFHCTARNKLDGQRATTWARGC